MPAIVAVGQAPVPPTTVLVAVGKPPVPTTTVAEASYAAARRRSQIGPVRSRRSPGQIGDAARLVADGLGLIADQF
ncbi:MAG: hypothetical protein R2697_14185 [Ilumatobacteraceae bacterium]